MVVIQNRQCRAHQTKMHRRQQQLHRRAKKHDCRKMQYNQNSRNSCSNGGQQLYQMWIGKRALAAVILATRASSPLFRWIHCIRSGAWIGSNWRRNVFGMCATSMFVVRSLGVGRNRMKMHAMLTSKLNRINLRRKVPCIMRRTSITDWRLCGAINVFTASAKLPSIAWRSTFANTVHVITWQHWCAIASIRATIRCFFLGQCPFCGKCTDSWARSSQTFAVSFVFRSFESRHAIDRIGDGICQLFGWYYVLLLLYLFIIVKHFVILLAVAWKF